MDSMSKNTFTSIIDLLATIDIEIDVLTSMVSEYLKTLNTDIPNYFKRKIVDEINRNKEILRNKKELRKKVVKHLSAYNINYII